MGQFNSFRRFAYKYRRLGSPGGSIEVAFLLAHAEIARVWGEEAKKMMEKDIYSQYIPTKKEYKTIKSRTGAVRAGRAFRRGGGMMPHPSGEPEGRGNKAWQRTHVLYNSQVVSHGITGVSMTNSARNKRGKQYAAARHNLGTEKSSVQNSIWTKVVQFQTESRSKLQQRGFFMSVYMRYLSGALSNG